MIFGFCPKNLKMEAVAVTLSMSWQAGGGGADRALGGLAAFRRELYCCEQAAGRAG